MANPLLGSLVDPFTAAALNTGVWNGNSGTVSLAAPGRVAVGATSTASVLGAVGPYEATAQALYARVTPALAGTGGGAVVTTLTVQQDPNNRAYLTCTPGTAWQAVVVNAGVTTTVNLPAFDPAQHAWWQLTESSGQWLFSVSADGAAWTQVAAIAYTWSAHAVSVAFSGQSSTVTGQSAYLEHLNTPLGTSPLMPSWPQIRFQVAFNTGAQMTQVPAYVDLSKRLRGSWSATQAGRQYELDQVQSGQLTLTLANTDGALDPLNTGSPYSPNVLPMRPCRLQAVWPPTRNLLPQDYSTGTSLASEWYAYLGTAAPVTGLSPAPTGHTAAMSWQFPITASGANTWPLLTGTNGGNADPTAFPVVAGQSYTWSCWLSRSSGGDTTVGVLQDILWYDKTGAQISGSGGTLSSIPVLSTWAQNTFTATAPAGAVSARIGTWLTNTATTAVNTLYFTAMQLEQAAAASPWTAGGVVVGLWTGFVERWPQQWNFSGTYGLVDLTCIDALAGLAQFTLQPNFQAQLASLGPDLMYPFNEPQGSTSFADATGQKPNRFTLVSWLGAGGGSITAGNSVQGSGSVGSSGPVITVTNPNYGQGTPKAGVLIAAKAGQVPPNSGGLTRIICYRTTTVPSAGNVMALWVASGPGAFSTGTGSKGVLGIYLDSNQHLYGYVSDTTGTYTASITVPDIAACDGNWHIAVIQVSSDGKTFTVANDNYGYQAVLSSGSYQPLNCNSDTIAVSANESVAAWNYYYQGDLAYAVEIPYAIGNTVAFDVGNGFSTGWSGEYSSARIQRILNLANYKGAWGYQGSTVLMGGANLAGTDPVSAMTLVGDTEAGQVYVDGSGVLWMTGRLWRYLQSSPTVVFGENQSSGEVPYLGDVALDFDTTHIYNVAQVSQVVPPGSTQPPAVYYSSAASEQAYLPRTVQRSINTQDKTLQLATGQYIVSQYGQPLPRLAALNVDPASNPALWSTVLGLGFGTRAQVNRRPPSGPGAAAISVQQFVEHIVWNGDDQGNFKVALQLTPAAPYLNWWVASSLHTTVATASAAGTATVTLGALTGSANNPASAVLVPGTQLTLSYGTANAETLTVKSVASTTAGYTSVAVTFTANTAHNHAVGDVVCQPLPANYALPAAVAASFPASLDAGATLSASGPRAAY